MLWSSCWWQVAWNYIDTRFKVEFAQQNALKPPPLPPTCQHTDMIIRLSKITSTLKRTWMLSRPLKCVPPFQAPTVPPTTSVRHLTKCAKYWQIVVHMPYCLSFSMPVRLASVRVHLYQRVAKEASEAKKAIHGIGYLGVSGHITVTRHGAALNIKQWGCTDNALCSIWPQCL